MRQTSAERQVQYRLRHPDRYVAAYQKRNAKKLRWRPYYRLNWRYAYKLSAINVYTNGEATCRLCGNGDIDILCLDHIKDDGSEFRAAKHGGSQYRWLAMHDYPEGFQVLCASCNLKKEIVRRRGTNSI